MPTAAGDIVGGGGVQPPIGAYVQDSAAPSGNTNYIGVNTLTSYASNPLNASDTNAPQPNWVVPANDNPLTGGTAQLVKNGATALIPTDKVTISAGVATKDNSTGTHTVFATVPANYFFWAVTTATT